MCTCFCMCIHVTYFEHVHLYIYTGVYSPCLHSLSAFCSGNSSFTFISSSVFFMSLTSYLQEHGQLTRGYTLKKMALPPAATANCCSSSGRGTSPLCTRACRHAQSCAAITAAEFKSAMATPALKTHSTPLHPSPALTFSPTLFQNVP